ncbi:MAG: hypothetical protein WDO73_12885 [Ignavibacteriota bacterium]
MPTARLTRKYTTRVLLDAMKRFATPAAGNTQLSIMEIGGANSCFLDRILEGVGCRQYDIVDTNAYGLSLLQQRPAPTAAFTCIRRACSGWPWKRRPTSCSAWG